MPVTFYRWLVIYVSDPFLTIHFLIHCKIFPLVRLGNCPVTRQITQMDMAESWKDFTVYQKVNGDKWITYINNEPTVAVQVADRWQEVQ